MRDAPILLLDEPTAHLDATTEAAIGAAILDLAQGRIVILASHSSWLLGQCQQVVQLQAVPQITEAKNQIPEALYA